MSGGRIKSLASDTMIYGVFTIVGRFLTFLLTPIYSNYLTKSEVGEISNIFAIVAFVNIIYSFGMETSFLRFWKFDSKDGSIYENEEQKQIKVFTISWLTIFFVSLISTIILLLTAGLYSSSVIELENSTALLRYAILLPFLDCMLIVPMAMLRMTRNAKRFALSRFLMIICAVALNVIFITVFKWGVYGIFYAQIISSIFGISLLSPFILKYVRFKLDTRILRDMLKFGIPTIPAALSGMILQVVNIPILKLTTNAENVALYSINNRLAIPMMLFVSVFEYAWKPFYLSRYDDEDSNVLFARVFTYFTLASSILFLIIIYFIEFIVAMPFIGGKFINPVYWQGMSIVPLVMLGFYFNGAYNNFASSFHIEKKTQYLPVSIGISAALNIILNFSLIPLLNITGSALATLLSYFVSAVILLFLAKKIRHIKYEWKRVIVIFSVSAVFWYLGELTGMINSITVRFFARVLLLPLFIGILALLKVFTGAEINSIKGLFIRGVKMVTNK